MASHVVVIDSSARRATVKVTPAKPLTDVLDEACRKLGLDTSQYGLKHNNKPVDVSRSIRLSGLSSGAKLELVQLSKSPSVVSVALQVPEAEAQGIPNGRLTDKFPSNTTLWQVLRRFEAGVAGGGGASGRNLTAKGVPVTSNGSSGAGGLYYQQPVIGIMGRELSTFPEMQKTLGQLGFNSGSTLLRLSFKTSDTPMHEAMSQIAEYFKEQGVETASPAAQNTTQQTEATSSATPELTSSTDLDTSMSEAPSSAAPPTAPADDVSLSSRPISIYSAPSSSTPFAATTRTLENEADYIPTVEHAQAHQRTLQAASRNIRLPTDSELEAQAAATREKLAAIASVEIKIRFLDQTSIVSTFTQQDTGASLYSFVRECLSPTLTSEPFLLKFTSPSTSRGPASQLTVPDSSSAEPVKLIQGLQLRGRVLMTFSWDSEKASLEARQTKSVLKEELREKAREIEVPDVSKFDGAQEKDEVKGTTLDVGKGEERKKDSGSGEKKIPKWLKLPGKK